MKNETEFENGESHFKVNGNFADYGVNASVLNIFLWHKYNAALVDSMVLINNIVMCLWDIVCYCEVQRINLQSHLLRHGLRHSSQHVV